MNLKEYAEFKAQADGRRPKRLFGSLIDGQSIDSDVVRETPCEKCGGQRIYEAVYDGGTYYAFAICHRCGEAESF